ncbi:ketoacyl-ACP synthase III [Chryseobacterium sp. CFBP8996]|uniref:ketoacyl-ACP synthase III n=1 Tax=Chryseobacterium sp. CFBP8996 TaxID=3096529 RepID=UPI002A69AC89|nr:ketoacyl-ACP synthase III [Chryseobacterium sp. CFBP8996]MDY0933036.1 ketoacyl-ACP synthase III [Chryseobacterium sp. CFBP8996]
MKSFIKAISIYVPSVKITNQDIALKFPEWDSEKIFDKIGIKQRYIAKDDEFVSDMSVEVIRNLTEEYSIDLSIVDYFILCTQSPDYQLPTTACIIQDRVGLSKNCAAIDINQGCSGYIYGLSLASSLVSSGNFKNVLLVTADMYSKTIHPDDKGNISLFGDAATATLISTEGEYEIGKFTLGSDGSGAENLIVKNGATKNKKDDLTQNLDNYLYMNGSAIFDFTAKNVPVLVEKNLNINFLSIEDIDMYVFHQANTFMLNFLRKRIGIEKEKFLLNMENYGNTVSSSIPLAFKDSYNKNLDKVMFVGFGVGYSWGAVTIFKINNDD